MVLVADRYDEYLAKLKAVNQAQSDAFSTKPQEKFNKAIDENKKKVAEAKSTFDKLKDAVKQVFSGNITGGLIEFKNAIGGIQAGILGVVAALGAMQVVKFIQQSGEVAKNNQTMGVVLEQVGKNAKYSKEQVSYALDSVKKMGITTSAASHSLVSMAQSEIEWTSASKLARIAQDAAVIGMTNSSDAFDRMIYGIKTGQIEVLRTLGIQVNFQAAYTKMASTLHKSAQALTEEEKAQARVNAVLDAGEKIAGTYEAAMGTAGKMQSSMARLIEETQNNIGQLLLPLETLIIKMQYDFWKGAEQATAGLKEWGTAIDAIIIGLGNLQGKTEESKGMTFAENLGKALHDAARTLIQFHVGAVAMLKAFGAGIDVLVAKVMNLTAGFTDIGQVVAATNKAMLTGNYSELVKTIQDATDPQKRAERMKSSAELAGKDIGQTMGQAWTDSLVDQISAIEKMHPDWLSEYGETAKKVDLAPQVSEAEKLAGKYQEQIGQLQAQAALVSKLNDIYKNYTKAVGDLGKQHDKQLANLDKQLGKEREQLEKKTGKALLDLDKDTAKRQADLTKQAQKQQLDTIKQAHKDMEAERKRFDLEQIQARRKFNLQEKWLMAEGDVLGLMQARENFDEQQKEAKENFDLQSQQSNDNVSEQLQKQRESMDEQMRQLQADVQGRRQEIADSYTEELQDLMNSNAEKRAEIDANYQEQLQTLKDNRDEQLKTLAKSFQDQQGMTSEAMQGIANEIAKVFGDQGAADLMMRSWNDRTKEGFEATFASLESRIKQLQARVTSLSEGGSMTPAEQGVPTELPGGYRNPKARGMAQGGVGVATGPALFAIEPGIKEAFAFMPLNRGGNGTRSQLDVNVGGNIDVRGASGASPGVVDSAVQVVFEELRTAIKRIKKV